jgi:hypothetical protein
MSSFLLWMATAGAARQLVQPMHTSSAQHSRRARGGGVAHTGGAATQLRPGSDHGTVVLGQRQAALWTAARREEKASGGGQLRAKQRRRWLTVGVEGGAVVSGSKA